MNKTLDWTFIHTIMFLTIWMVLGFLFCLFVLFSVIIMIYLYSFICFIRSWNI